MEFFPEILVSAVQAETMARGLYAIALVDGVHERELALISDLYHATVALESGEHETAASLATLTPLDAAGVKAVLLTPELRMLFVKSALLLAWADGNVSTAERTAIAEYAQALAITASELQRLELEVKDYLLRPFANLTNVEAVAKVAHRLNA